MNKIILLLFSLLTFTASPLYAIEYTFFWYFHSKHTTYKVQTTVSVAPNGSQTVSHKLPAGFDFSYLMTGKHNDARERKIPKGPINLMRVQPEAKQLSEGREHRSQQVMTQPPSSHEAVKVIYQQGSEKLELPHGIDYMDRLMANPFLPSEIKGLICFPWLPSYAFPGNVLFHHRILKSIFVHYSDNIVFADVSVIYGSVIGKYYIALVRQNEYYGLIVSHEALTGESAQSIANTITPVSIRSPCLSLLESQVEPTASDTVSLIKQALEPVNLGKHPIYITAIPSETFQTLTSMIAPTNSNPPSVAPPLRIRAKEPHTATAEATTVTAEDKDEEAAAGSCLQRIRSIICCRKQ